MIQRTRRRRQVLALLGDLAVLFLALTLALTVRHGDIPFEARWWEHVKAFAPLFSGWIVVFYIAGLYSPETTFNAVPLAQRLFGAVGVSALGTALAFYLWRDSRIAPKTVLAATAVIAFVGLWGVRFFFAKLRRRYLPRRGVAFIGATDEALALAELTVKQPGLGVEVRLFFATDDGSLADSRFPVVRTPEAFLREMRASGTGLAVIAQEAGLDAETRRALFLLLENRTRFMRLPDFYEAILRRVPVGAINDAWFLENLDLQAKRPYELLKRGIDLLVAALALGLTAALWPLVAGLVKLESPGPVLFKQVRLGRFDEHFTILKFRTMRVDGNTFAPTGVRDARVTRFGALMRASRLDELPQLINILKGDMSLVGPRPERPELAMVLEKAIPYYRQRHLVKPGVTGWDQVSGEYHSPSVEDTYKKLQYDLYYIRNMSLFLDASIVLKTIGTVLSHGGR
jgi:exopolysaccharide biosynthesis polyprenyl glycosylphosphotransferase